MNSVKLMVDLICGGFIGYFTNNYAINMIFRQYQLGPLKIGGVIIDTREEFIDSLSRLVEKDIINHDALKDELHRKEFRHVFGKLVTDFCAVDLAKQIRTEPIGQLPGMDTTWKNCLAFYDLHKERLGQAVAETFGPHIRIGDLFEQEQLNVIVKNILAIAITTLSTDEVLPAFLRATYEENQNSTVAEFITPALLEKFAEGLGLQFTANNLKESMTEEITRFLHTLYEQLAIDAGLANLWASVQNKTPVQLLGNTRVEKLAAHLIAKLLDYLRSDAGQQLIFDVVETILAALNRVDMPLLQLVSTHFNADLEALLGQYLPRAIERLLSWIKANKNEIETLIEEAIQSAIDQEGWFKKQIKTFLYDLLFTEGVTKKFNLVLEIIKVIEDQAEPEEISHRLTAEIITLLKTKKINLLIQELKEQGLLNAAAISHHCQQGLAIIVARLDAKTLANHGNIAIGQLAKGALLTAPPNKSFLCGIIRDEIIFSDTGTQRIRHWLNSWAHAWQDTKIGQLIIPGQPEANWATGEKSLLRLLENNQDLLGRNLAAYLWRQCRDKTWAATIHGQQQKLLWQKLGTSSRVNLNEKIKKIQQFTLGDYYDLLDMDALVAELDQWVHALLSQHGNRLMEGQIQGIVANNLHQLSDRELQTMVEAFMGAELKPITRFGALLGAVGGGTIGTLSFGGVPGFALAAGVYGFIGYITNVIALKMIFRPYQKKKILGIKIPFTPGVIAQEQSRFAQNMGAFVRQDLFSTEAVTAIFREHEDLVRSQLRRAWAKDDYRALEALLLDKVDFLAAAALARLDHFYLRHREPVVAYLVGLVEHLRLKQINLNPLQPAITKFLLAAPGKAREPLQAKLLAGLRSPEPLAVIIPPWVRDWLDPFIESVVQAQMEKPSQYLGDAWNSTRGTDLLAGWLEPHLSKSWSDLLSPDRRDRFKTAATTTLIELLQSPAARAAIIEVMASKIRRAFPAHQQLAQIFNGMLTSLLQANLNGLAEGISKLLLQMLTIQKATLKEVAATAAEESHLYRAGNYFLDLNGTLATTIDILIDEKIPAFMDSQRPTLVQLTKDLLDFLGRIELAELGVALNRSSLRDLTDNLLRDPQVMTVLRSFADSLMTRAGQKTVRATLQAADIDDASALFRLFEREIQELQQHFSRQFHENRGLIGEELIRLVVTALDQLLLNRPLADLTAQITAAELGPAVDRILGKLINSPVTEKALARLSGELLAALANQEPAALIDLPLLQEDLLRTMDGLAANEQLHQSLAANLNQALHWFFRQINGIVAPATKDYLLTATLNGLFLTLERNLPALLAALHVDQVTEKQINGMDPRDIEQMFYSFAGKYFRRLEQYGWLGAAGALLAALLKFGMP